MGGRVATKTKEKDQVISTQWGVKFTRDVLNTDNTVWRREGDVEEMPNFQTAKANLCIYRLEGWPVKLVMRQIKCTPWMNKG